jgi:GNAT superfamily N-acetyltransferase
MERCLDEPILEVHIPFPVTIAPLESAAIDAYVSFRAGTDAQVIRHRLIDGQVAFVVWHKGHIVHAGWTVTKRAWIAFLDCDIGLAADTVYQYESYTAPEFRGQNLAAARITAMLRYYRAAGYRRLVAVVVPENRAAFRPLAKAGYRPFGRMGYIKIGPWRRDFCHTPDAAVVSGDWVPLALGMQQRNGHYDRQAS